MPPSAGEIIPCRTVWLLLNEWMWVTMSLSPGATTAWCSGRSWIWNNKTVNGLHHCYWFFLSLAQCFMSAIVHKYVAAARARNQAFQGVVHVDEVRQKEDCTLMRTGSFPAGHHYKGRSKSPTGCHIPKMLKFVFHIWLISKAVSSSSAAPGNHSKFPTRNTASQAGNQWCASFIVFGVTWPQCECTNSQFQGWHPTTRPLS